MNSQKQNQPCLWAKGIFAHVALLIGVVLPLGLWAQGADKPPFYVIQASEDLSLKGGGPLEPGQELSIDAVLVFGSPEATGHVIFPGQGRFVLAVQEAGTFVLAQTLRRGGSQTKGKSQNGGPATAEHHFGSGNYLLFADEVRIGVDTRLRPLGPDQFYVLKYAYEDEPLELRLPAEADTLILRRTDLLGENGRETKRLSPIELHYVSGPGQAPALVATFRLREPQTEMLRTELRLIAEVLEITQTPRPEIQRELAEFVVDAYGRFDPKGFTQWVERQKLLAD